MCRRKIHEAGYWTTGGEPRHIIAHFVGAPMRDVWWGLCVGASAPVGRDLVLECSFIYFKLWVILVHIFFSPVSYLYLFPASIYYHITWKYLKNSSKFNLNTNMIYVTSFLALLLRSSSSGNVFRRESVLSSDRGTVGPSDRGTVCVSIWNSSYSFWPRIFIS